MNKKKETKKTTKIKNKTIIIAFIFLAVVVGVALLHFWIKFDFLTFVGITNKSSTIGQWGTVGDYMGGILNPFLSLMALVLLLKAMN
jgi:hypothetical protein